MGRTRRKSGNYRNTYTIFDIKLLDNYHEKTNKKLNKKFELLYKKNQLGCKCNKLVCKQTRELYAILLEDNGNSSKKYVYCGETWNANKRIEEHKNGYGAKFTNNKLVVKTLETRSYCKNNKHAEEDITLKYMEKYGIDSVRGAQWCYESHTFGQKKEICSKLGRCYKCYKTGHFANNCYS